MLIRIAVTLTLLALSIPGLQGPAGHARSDLAGFNAPDGDTDQDGTNDGAKATAGLGNGGSAADTITLFVDALEKLAGDASSSSSSVRASNGQGGQESPADPMTGLGQNQSDQWCGWASLAAPLDPNNPAWDGHSAADGEVRWKSCPILGPGTAGAPGNLEGRPVVYQFFPNGVIAPPPPPDPAVLAQRAIRQLTVPPPPISVGPDRSKLAVNLWTWLWIDDPGPLTATAAAGGISVTATASLSSVTWSLGEPAATGGPYADGPPVTLTCQGTGTPPPANYDWKAEPPCGHMYTWRSTKERTSGTGTWPITATSNWTVTWQSNTGVTGGTTLSATSNDALEIGEYRTVLVDGPGG